jgi:hypothetical protein
VLYGTTEAGGSAPTCKQLQGCGTVFELKPSASPGGAWTESVYPLPGGKFGYIEYPTASPTVGPNGELYATTYYGGIGVGSVIELMPPASAAGTWTETVLYSFSPPYGDPQNPQAGVVIGKNGVLYGTVPYAGLSPSCPYSYESLYGCGGVFSLTPPASPGGAWTEQTLYTFQGGDDGGVPLAGLAMGKNGELYGTTYYGGPSSTCSPALFVSGCGTVFELDPPASPGGSWTKTVLYSFAGAGDGGYPNAVVYQGGILYGTVTFGGDLRTCGGVGCGGVFRLNPPASSGGSWTESLLYGFTGVPDGSYPAAGLVIANDGTLYGTTRDGGHSKSCPQDPGCGVVFKLTPPRNAYGPWREAVLHSFTAVEGSRPTAAPVIGKNGNLYGTNLAGGTSNSTTCAGGCGTVFEFKPNNPSETYQ